MSLGKKLAKLRKENNYTQEQLAEILNVSRQAVSKWESDVAYPETDKLLKIGELYNCSMDYLLKDNTKKPENCICVKFDIKSFCFEKKSKKMVLGMPLWHINIGWGRTAKGIIAIGLCAKGIISLGLATIGVLSVGILSLGVFALGTLALGLLSAGTIAIGILAFGAICIGVFAAGALAIGEFSIGALSIGNYFALGDHAYADIAIGHTKAFSEIHGSYLKDMYDRKEIVALLDETVPKIFVWAKELIKLFI